MNIDVAAFNAAKSDLEFKRRIVERIRDRYNNGLDTFEVWRAAVIAEQAAYEKFASMRDVP